MSKTKTSKHTPERFTIKRAPMQGTSTKWLLKDNETGLCYRCRTKTDAQEQITDLVDMLARIDGEGS